MVSVILQAIEDLGDRSKKVVKSAEEFLSGRDGALKDICDFAELNYLAIVNHYKELGARNIRKIFAKNYMLKEESHNVA